LGESFVRSVPFAHRCLVVAFLVSFVAACRGSGGSAPTLPAADLGRGQAAPDWISEDRSHKIKHVVIIIQENRSFNDLFYGFPGAKTAEYGYDTHHQRIKLRPISLAIRWDILHNAYGALAACNGTGSIRGTHCRMNGFNEEKLTLCGSPSRPRCPSDHPQYAYVPREEVKPYLDMAKQYVLADEMFASDFDASSFVSHQYIIAAQAESSVNYPDLSRVWGCPGGPLDKVGIVNQNRQFPVGHQTVCWNAKTLGDELDKARLPWAFYASAVGPHVVGHGGIWSAYQVIEHIYRGSDWREDIISPQTRFFDDLKPGQRGLGAVTWITPDYRNSDHAGSGSKTGPSWVASLVNAIGESPYWKSTAIFIFWDDYGGWYDPEPPAYVDYDGLGFRLPLLIISPYAKMGHVSHVHYEHGSILKFVEDQFGLARLSASDERANSPESDCFDFSQRPRKFVPISAPYHEDYFLRQPIDTRPPDTE
jgi:phospholipase C